MTISQIGQHRIQHGSLMDGVEDLMAGERAWITWVDPPWGPGNLTYWNTINHKMTGADTVAPPFTDFLTTLFAMAWLYTEQFFFCEYGLRWHDQVEQLGRDTGFVTHGSIRCQYKGGNKMYPHDLHVFTKGPVFWPSGYMDSIEGASGYREVQLTIAPIAKPGAILFDPCCGLGYAAQAAIDTGMRFRGNELNGKRLERTRQRLVANQRTAPGAVARP